MRKRDPTEAATPPITAAPAPRRRRGRPPVTPGELKRHPVALYVTKALKDQLVEASKISGRPLTGEIEARLLRTLAEDHGKSELEVRVDKAMVELKETVFLLVGGYHHMGAETTLAKPTPKSKSRRAQRSEAVGEQPAPTDLADDQRHGDRDAGGQSARAMLARVGEPGQPGLLVPIEISLLRRDDGSVSIVGRHGGLVISESPPLDIATAQQLAGELLEACESGQKEELQETQTALDIAAALQPV